MNSIERWWNEVGAVRFTGCGEVNDYGGFGNSSDIGPMHLFESITYRTLDRKLWA